MSEMEFQEWKEEMIKLFLQGAGGPNHYPIYRPLCLLGIDACIYWDMVK
jgi:hypothetical protein